MRFCVALLLMLIFILLVPSVNAEEMANLNKSSKSLNKIKQKLDNEISEKEHLSEKMELVYAELSNTKQDLIAAAKLIRENETNLRDLEARIKKLEENKLIIEQKLKNDRSSISRLIMTLERIRRTPPEVIIASPTEPFKTAQSALIMGQLIPVLERHSKALKKNLQTLQNVTNDLKKEQENHHKLSRSLKSQHVTISSLLDARESIYRQTSMDIQNKEEKIHAISLKAQNLEDLVSKLKAEEAKQRTRMEIKRQDNKDEEELLTSLSERLEMKRYHSKPEGEAQLPISGFIKIGYHQKDDLGAVSNGITLEGRASGIVVAPLSGVIQFAGVFKKYGNIVIIEHKNGFHSLVAGLEKIDTLVGEFVESGEPIGALPVEDTSGGSPKLYYELRQNGKPVSPSIKFADLG